MEKIDIENNAKPFHKLIRDKIIEKIENRGEKAVYNILDNENYIKELNKKLIEEANEFIVENNVEELADIFEVIYTIMKNRNIDITEVEEIRKKKRDERGGFENKIFLKEIIE